MQVCPHCGHSVPTTAKICPVCGRPLPVTTQTTASDAKAKPRRRQSLYDDATARLNRYTGEEGAVKVNLKDLFSAVFQHHTKAEAESVFIAGTEDTTPALDSLSDAWVKPWLFSRILVGFLLAFMALLFMAVEFQNPNAIPGLILVGAFAVPVSGLVFFFEANAFQDISLYEVMRVFFIGGIFALIATLFLYQFISFSQTSQMTGMLTLGDSLSIGVVEEVGKLLITCYFINQLHIKHILGGMLIGAAVGAGFAAFETAGYIYRAGNLLVEVAILRGWSAIGGHLVWAAIAGGAVMVVKRAKPLRLTHLFDTRFLVFFGIAILLHAAWDWDIGIIGPYFKLLLLIIAAWVVVFVLMNAGLKEVSHLQQRALEHND
ncbi:PrsW family glutamic-type intramembrane protease [Levilactobacillus zymae]|uniref:PrsW family glutamic-type intramembrane protease n=1 Tax=Levilactobacillus zymae TaxID=267363 RepID=UPI0028B43E85|nr:PrsW family glutamic-type intramembrane protease [Levilactobacillus zymae]MDT6979629.1 PrsW family glutamic-type intramembrane protease [Levilactobacillus zymae]